MKVVFMLCCALITALAGLLLRAIFIRGATPALAWRLGTNPPQAINMSAPRRTTRWRSFGFALAGLRFAVGQEPNMRIHVGAAITAGLAGALLRISAQEWGMLASTQESKIIFSMSSLVRQKI
jgi:hypothetical protein